MTQRELVLTHLQRNPSLSSAEAYELYGCMRLSAVIFDLRAEGSPIVTTPRTEKNRYGHSVTFADYSLPPSTFAKDSLVQPL